MAKNRRKIHDIEVKRTAVKMVAEQGYSISDTAGALHVGYGTVWRWVNGYDGAPAPGEKRPVKDLRSLKEGLMRLQSETGLFNDVLASMGGDL